MKSRIAIFEGYASPRGYGGPIVRNPRPMSRYGAPILQNPQMGRRSYYVPPERAYGPVRSAGGRRPVVRKGYKVRRMKDTPAMKRAQSRFKKASKTCSRKTRVRGSFQACMKKALRKKR